MNFDELVVDNFAGGGGASTGIELALGRSVDIAINHDPLALAMHEVNHPSTKHYCESVWDIDPRVVTDGRPVGLAWFSPDCRHFSKAKGGAPVSARVRGLAWIVLKWIGTVRPRVIMLENVEEFATWGPLVKDANGDQWPCPKRKGKTFRSFISAIERHGYKVETRELRACDYGAPTIRKRLFLIARCDGQPILWPEPTHGKGLLPYRTAAEIIDWSLPCPSIFTRKKPLAEKTLRRIAEGLRRFVIDSPYPFIVQRYGERQGQRPRTRDIHEPMPTIVPDGNHGALVVPVIAGVGGRAGQSRPRGGNEALATITGKADAVLVSAFLAKHYGGHTTPGWPLDKSISTITAYDHHALVTSHIVKLRNNQYGQDARDPIPTLTAGGGHVGEVRAFLMKYYSEGGQWQSLQEPLHTVPTKARMGLVLVHGEPYQIVDIGMRMLEPHELFAAQGFPTDYIIDRDAHGNKFTKATQVAKCGNSVCPPLAEALVRANYSATIAKEVAA
jgi:DNA (cytosine-5)-methyltransferase 1